MNASLASLLRESAKRYAERTAVEDPSSGASVTYEELDSLSDALAERLTILGVGPGDRVGVAGKSIGILVAIFATLKSGAAYVPVDATAPARRSASIFADCGVKAIVATADFAERLGVGVEPERIEALTPYGPDLVLFRGPGGQPPEQGLAYILYTSGSTGMPKGVMHTHASALAFVDWCSDTFMPTCEDRFSSHAPLHFDLSILDILVPLKHGAAVVLIGEELGKQPAGLAEVIAERRISVWYSTPSILTLLLEFGKLDRFELPNLRLVLFAGEVFPIRNLRRLKERWSGPRYCNLYGPTETNVCTWFDVPAEVPAERADPFPIGVPCSGDRARVMLSGAEVPVGEEGELFIAGGSVMRGYWNQPERTTEAFFVDPDGSRWYGTGDLVRPDEEGNFVFLGRGDRMIKRRGYRIEPGEIEAALYRHPDVIEAAAFGTAAEDGATSIVACLVTRDGEPLSMIGLKRWCSENLPMYMIPDRFTYLDALPKTSTDKVNYRALMGAS